MDERPPANTNDQAAAGYTGPALCALPARAVVDLLSRGELSGSEVLDAALTRIATVEPQVNAVVTICEERARGALTGLAGRQPAGPGWLAGLPFAVKDNAHVKGVCTTFGTMGLKDQISPLTDPVVARLEDRGAVVIGKTNTPEMAVGGNTFNAVFGPTRNPWNTALNAGGSSGGAAVALATGEVWLAHGNDFAGSLRTPPAYCGVVGLRPTPGRCGGGPAGYAYSMEAVTGPMARDVTDLALFLDAMSGHDPRSPISLDAPAQSYRAAVDRADGPVRLAFSDDLGGFAPVEPAIRQALRNAMERLRAGGFVVEESCPDITGLEDTFRTIRGLHFATLTSVLPPSLQQHFKPTLQQSIRDGQALDSARIARAFRQRGVLYETLSDFFGDFDVLACPVVGIAPRDIAIEYPDMVEGIPSEDYLDWLRFSFLAATASLPALSLPIGFLPSGMPMGIQLIARSRDEAGLLRVARLAEMILGTSPTPIDPRPPAT